MEEEDIKKLIKLKGNLPLNINHDKRKKDYQHYNSKMALELYYIRRTLKSFVKFIGKERVQKELDRIE